MRSAAVALVASFGCGRIGFDPRASGVDATDAALAFSTPTELAALNTTFNDGDPAVTADQLELYFDSDRAGGLGDDLYVSRRGSTSDAWPPAVRVDELSSANSDVAPGIAADGLTIYFTRNGSGGGYEIFVATRSDRSAPWNPPAAVPELSSPLEDTNPQPSADGLELWFASRRGGEQLRQIYLATRTTMAAPWSPPARVDALFVDPAIYTADPWPTPDGTGLYFASDRGGPGNKDLWFVDRPAPTTFDAPVLVGEINSPHAEADPCLSPDLRTIYFTSRRPDGADNDLFIATR